MVRFLQWGAKLKRPCHEPHLPHTSHTHTCRLHVPQPGTNWGRTGQQQSTRCPRTTIGRTRNSEFFHPTTIGMPRRTMSSAIFLDLSKDKNTKGGRPLHSLKAAINVARVQSPPCTRSVTHTHIMRARAQPYTSMGTAKRPHPHTDALCAYHSRRP